MDHGPTAGEAEAVRAMRANHAHWNNLVALGRERETNIHALLRAISPDVAAAVAAVEAEEQKAEAESERLCAEGVARKKANEKAYRNPALLAARRAYWSAEKAAKADPGAGPSLSAIDADWRAAVKAARPTPDVANWANYNEVEQNYQQACRPAPGKGRPRFHSWRGDGRILVRWQNGLPVADLFGDDTRCRVEPVGPLAWSAESRGDQRRLQRTVMRVRVCSADRKPVWLTLPIVLHRPLPAGGLVRSVVVLRERIGTHFRWKVAICVELPEALAAPTPRGVGAIGIDLGWRRRYDGDQPLGTRIAVWHDDRGRTGEVLLPERWLVAMGKVEDIQSIRDTGFNVARTALAAWLKGAVVPDWLTEATRTLSQWRSPARLAALALSWRGQRFEGDEEAYGSLERWRVRDKHLLEYASNLRDKLLGARREQYRMFAAWVAREYAEVKIEQFDLRPMADLEKEGGELPALARYQRFSGSPSELRLAIENACRRAGVAVVKVDARNTTRRCHVCETVAPESIVELNPVCPVCLTRFDQDERAAINLLNSVPQMVGA